MKKKTLAKNKSELVKTYGDGTFQLWYYTDRGYVLLVQLDLNKFFFVEIPTLNEYVEDMNEIIRLKGGAK